MNSPLVRMKFQRPSVGNTVLQRPHLLHRLAADSACAVTLVTAPAGFGKSTLVSSYIQLRQSRTDIADSGRPQACWLSLDEEDSHFPTFLLYLIASIEASIPGCCEGVSELTRQHPAPAIETLAAVLVNLLSRLEESLILVLDDVHRVNDSAVFAFLASFIEYAPAKLHMILISRTDPPLPLNRWRAGGRLCELRLHDLSFSLEETIAFFRAHLDEMPSPSLIETIHARTEGWIVGNLLALLVLRSHNDYDKLANHFQTQTNRYTVDYLVDEVLNQQAPDIQRFLVCTAILNRFSIGLSAAVLHVDEDHAVAQINHLRKTNLFLIELDTSGRWFRYHNQFQTMLLSRLHMRYDQETIAALHRRAAAWLVAQKQIDEALLHLCKIPDHVAAADLIEQQRIRMLNESAFGTLEAWLNQVPTAFQNQRVHLLVSMAWVQHHRADHQACRKLVQRAMALLARESGVIADLDRQLLMAELRALEMSSDLPTDPEASLACIRQNWILLRRNLAHTHCAAVLALAYTSQQLGEMELAQKIVRITLEEATAWPQAARCRIAHAAGFFQFCTGNCADAAQQFQRNLLLAKQHNMPTIEMISRHGLGAIAGVQNQLKEAEEHHKHVVMHLDVTSGREAALSMYELISIYARRGEPEKGHTLVGQLKEDVQTMDNPYFLEQVTALQAYADLACGHVEQALRWALGATQREMRSVTDRFSTIRVRIFLVDGSDACLDVADQITQGLLKLYAGKQLWHREAEALILQALVREQQGRPDDALAYMAEAVNLAVPRGGVGLFMGYGDVMRHLLRRLRRQPGSGRLASLVLTALDADEMTSQYKRPVLYLPEVLTERELDILQLLAARLSNKEIAAQLMVSPHTVRNHTANIYGKLQVGNRQEAVARAHAMGLLTPAQPHA